MRLTIDHVPVTRVLRRAAWAAAAALLLACASTLNAQEQPAVGSDQQPPAATVSSQAPAPPSNVVASDHPLDGGAQIDVKWDLSPDDPAPRIKEILRSAGVFEVKQLSKDQQEQVKALLATFGGYKVWRSMTDGEIQKDEKDARSKAESAAKAKAVADLLESLKIKSIHELSPEQIAAVREARAAAAEQALAEVNAKLEHLQGQTRWALSGSTVAGENTFTVDRLDPPQSYLFKVEAIGADGTPSQAATTAAAISPQLQWFDGARFWLAIIVLTLCGAVVFWINHARKGRPVRVRKIAGLEAVDEAVGRATEMGRSVLFVPGIQDMNDIQTIAGITVLSRVARTAAEYDAKVEVPTSRSLVMTAARETVQSSFLAAGRPDAYNQDLIYYVTDEQFGYVAYLSGMMVREKPAACFYMGSFFAESLILAETGNSIGAIQVAGTAQPAQLPFFVAACDYTLIGEEFFAASAYLSGSPEELGSLKGQDVGKIVVGAVMVVGISIVTLAAITGSTALKAIGDFIRGVMLT